MAYHKEQEAIHNQENREKEEHLLRLASEQEKTTKIEAAKNGSSNNKTSDVRGTNGDSMQDTTEKD